MLVLTRPVGLVDNCLEMVIDSAGNGRRWNCDCCCQLVFGGPCLGVAWREREDLTIIKTNEGSGLWIR